MLGDTPSVLKHPTPCPKGTFPNVSAGLCLVRLLALRIRLCVSVKRSTSVPSAHSRFGVDVSWVRVGVDRGGGWGGQRGEWGGGGVGGLYFPVWDTDPSS